MSLRVVGLLQSPFFLLIVMSIINEIEQIVQRKVDEALLEFKRDNGLDKMKSPDDDLDWLPEADVLKFFQCNKHNLRRLVKRENIVYSKIGNAYQYLKDDINELFHNYQITRNA